MALEPEAWLERAYSAPIAAMDIGLLDRCQILSSVTAMVLRTERLRRGRFLDWAGGYGTLTRLMRDRGYDFSHTDVYATNMFAQNHEAPADWTTESYDLVTAFEVLEHLPNPVADLADVAAVTDRLLASTVLLPDPPPRPDQWWYYTPESGQHITFYTPRSLELLAKELGYDGVVSGSFVHLFHRGPVKPATRALVARPPLAYGAGLLASVLDRRHSLISKDLERAKQQTLPPA